jgi:hypothetical protein
MNEDDGKLAPDDDDDDAKEESDDPPFHQLFHLEVEGLITDGNNHDDNNSRNIIIPINHNDESRNLNDTSPIVHTTCLECYHNRLFFHVQTPAYFFAYYYYFNVFRALAQRDPTT